MLKRIFDFFIFSSLFIALCAVVMVHQTYHLLAPDQFTLRYLLFVLSATITSYNFHWYLTQYTNTEIRRSEWSQRHKKTHLVLFLSGLAGSAALAFYFIGHWLALGVAGLLTFLYSAPKIPHPFFRRLKKMAVGKTLFLSFVWIYVTAILPLIIAEKSFTTGEILFCLSRFFFVYAVCIIFDYRDKESDKREGLQTLLTYLNEKWVNALFYFSLFAFTLFTILFGMQYHDSLLIFILLFPGLIPLLLFRKAKHDFSDYLYDFVLDGSMALSSLVMLFTHI